MLKTLDVLIGLTVILLALSMAVTVITQTITTIVNSRGRHLRRGLVDLLQQLDPALTASLSRTVATSILSHPLVSGSSLSMIGLGGQRLGNVVHREEFTRLLLALSADQGSSALETTAKDALIKALSANGVDKPGEMLKNIRQVALRLERSSPALSHTARQNLAILHAAESDLVAKINNWFDQTMDRTSQRFTASTRAITFVGAFVIAFSLQVDTPAIVNRLSADDELRQQLVKDAETLYAEYESRQAQTSAEPVTQPAPEAGQAGTAAATATPPSPSGSAPGGSTPNASSGGELTEAEMQMAHKHRAMLSAAGLIRLPTSRQSWSEGYDLTSVLGMLLTALLLSLGAPFWYNMLGRLLQLRSVLAVKDDKQRAERQMTEPGSGSVPERGDPSAISDAR